MSRRRFKEVERPAIMEKLDYAVLINRQIERCLRSSDEWMLANNVQKLESVIAEDDKDEQFREEIESATETISRPEYKYNCGVPIVSEGLGSPFMVEEPNTDWHAYFRACFNLLVRLGVAIRRTTVSG